MNNPDLPVLIQVLLNEGADRDARIAAARRLAERKTSGVLEVLLTIAQKEDVDEGTAYAVGEAIAKILIHQGRLNDAPLAGFTGPAYLGFDAFVARSQSLLK